MLFVELLWTTGVFVLLPLDNLCRDLISLKQVCFEAAHNSWIFVFLTDLLT